MKQKRVSFIDVDETLFPLEEVIEKYLKKTFPNSYKDYLRVKSENPNSYSFLELCNASNGSLDELKKRGEKKIIREVGDTNYFVTNNSYPGATSLMRNLNFHSRTIVFSKRGKEDDENFYFNNAYNKTEQWLLDNELYFDYLVLTHDKAGLVKSFIEKDYKVLAVIDDEPEQVKHMLKINNSLPDHLKFPVIMPLKRYNESLSFEMTEDYLIPVVDLDSAKYLVSFFANY